MLEQRSRDSGQRLAILQALRFVGAALVVYAHAFARMERLAPELAATAVVSNVIAKLGYLGVDLFFVISGFVMVWAHWEQFAQPGASPRFVAARLRRIVPLYWLITGVSVVALIVAPEAFSYGQRLDVAWLVKCFLFIPTLSPSGRLYSPLVGLGWTLNFEMYFYVLFAAGLLLPRRQAIAAIVCFLVASVAMGALFTNEAAVWQQSTNWLLLEFALGIVTAVAIKVLPPLPRRLRSAAAILAAATLVASLLHYPLDAHRDQYLWRVILWGLPCTSLVYAFALAEVTDAQPSRYRALGVLGNASYAIYLLQVFALPLIAHALVGLHGERILGADAFVLVLVVGSGAAGYVFHLAVERPLSARISGKTTWGVRRASSRAPRNNKRANRNGLARV